MASVSAHSIFKQTARDITGQEADNDDAPTPLDQFSTRFITKLGDRLNSPLKGDFIDRLSKDSIQQGADNDDDASDNPKSEEGMYHKVLMSVLRNTNAKERAQEIASYNHPEPSARKGHHPRAGLRPMENAHSTAQTPVMGHKAKDHHDNPLKNIADGIGRTATDVKGVIDKTIKGTAEKIDEFKANPGQVISNTYNAAATGLGQARDNAIDSAKKVTTDLSHKFNDVVHDAGKAATGHIDNTVRGVASGFKKIDFTPWDPK